MASRQLVPARVRWALIAMLVVGYAGLSHHLITSAKHPALGVAFVLGPVVGIVLAGLWSKGKRLLAAIGAVAAVTLTLLVYHQGLSGRWFFLAEHAGIQCALGIWFGSTLLPGRQPLISALAERVHGHLIPSMAAYTRRLTQAWVLYFFSMTTASLALFASGDMNAWSVLANMVTPVSMAMMFGVEYLLRYRLHPEFERVSLLESVRAYRAHMDERRARSHDDKKQ